LLKLDLLGQVSHEDQATRLLVEQDVSLLYFDNTNGFLFVVLVLFLVGVFFLVRDLNLVGQIVLIQGAQVGVPFLRVSLFLRPKGRAKRSLGVLPILVVTDHVTEGDTLHVDSSLDVLLLLPRTEQLLVQNVVRLPLVDTQFVQIGLIGYSCGRFITESNKKAFLFIGLHRVLRGLQAPVHGLAPGLQWAQAEVVVFLVFVLLLLPLRSDNHCIGNHVQNLLHFAAFASHNFILNEELNLRPIRKVTDEVNGEQDASERDESPRRHQALLLLVQRLDHDKEPSDEAGSQQAGGDDGGADK